MILAPGAIDCITGRAIARGVSAAYMTGAGTSATLGYPDYGLITMSEMGVTLIASRTPSYPLISDGDALRDVLDQDLEDTVKGDS